MTATALQFDFDFDAPARRLPVRRPTALTLVSSDTSAPAARPAAWSAAKRRQPRAPARPADRRCRSRRLRRGGQRSPEEPQQVPALIDEDPERMLGRRVGLLDRDRVAIQQPSIVLDKVRQDHDRDRGDDAPG
jgi:hypothetical protein